MTSDGPVNWIIREGSGSNNTEKNRWINLADACEHLINKKIKIKNAVNISRLAIQDNLVYNIKHSAILDMNQLR